MRRVYYCLYPCTVREYEICGEFAAYSVRDLFDLLGIEPVHVQALMEILR